MSSDMARKSQDPGLIYALDIGTRSVIGMVGEIVEERFKVLAIEKEEHGKRAMLDGQIDDIGQVAALVELVTRRLENKLGVHLTQVCVAAAGRALRTERAHYQLELDQVQSVGEEEIRRLEMGALTAAEKALTEDEESEKQFFLVGYIAAQYRLDRYPMTALLGHKGQVLEVEVVATFLPSEVVGSLYTTMGQAGLQVASMTLEPIAAMNAVIPADLRLLNLALVDVGAGTSDIAICRDGSVIGYTMVTLAGDEITESIMRAFLTDFQTAEKMKQDLLLQSEVCFTDILGMTQTLSAEEIYKAIQEPLETMAAEVAKEILAVNGGSPSALFLAGGGSKLKGLRDRLAEAMGMDPRRVAVAGNNFDKSAFSDEYSLLDPEYATPLGIAVSAGLGLNNDSYVIQLNGQHVKLFRNGLLTLQEVLFMNGYTAGDMIGKTGQSLWVTRDGQRLTFRGQPGSPAILRINGEEVSPNALVHAGDAIDFVPAHHGAPAVKTLRQLLGPEFQGSVLVNNQKADWDRPLASGDVIFTEAQPVVAPRATPVVEKPSVVPAAPVAPRPVTPSPVSPVESEPSPATIVLTGEAPPAPPVGESAPRRPAPIRPTREGIRFDTPISITLNGTPKNLEPKEDGAPYLLLDLLQFSGIDFQNVDQPVLLMVNGKESIFRQVIRDQDQVEIRCGEA